MSEAAVGSRRAFKVQRVCRQNVRVNNGSLGETLAVVELAGRGPTKVETLGKFETDLGADLLLAFGLNSLGEWDSAKIGGDAHQGNVQAGR